MASVDKTYLCRETAAQAVCRSTRAHCGGGCVMRTRRLFVSSMAGVLLALAAAFAVVFRP